MSAKSLLQAGEPAGVGAQPYELDVFIRIDAVFQRIIRAST